MKVKILTFDHTVHGSLIPRNKIGLNGTSLKVCLLTLSGTRGEIHHHCDIVQDLAGSGDVTLLNAGLLTRCLLSSANEHSIKIRHMHLVYLFGCITAGRRSRDFPLNQI